MCGFAETLGRSQLSNKFTVSRVSFRKPKLTFYLFLAVRIASLHTTNLLCGSLCGLVDACYHFTVTVILFELSTSHATCLNHPRF